MKKLVVNNVSQKYRRKQVLKNVNIEIHQGEIIGVLGLNGAGKTTLLKILSGVSEPKHGEVTYNNQAIKAVDKLNEVLFVPDEIILPKNLTGAKIAEMFKERNDKFNETYLNEYLLKLGIDLNESIKNLSKGNKELLQLGLLLANCPEVVILDEPLGAVDILKRSIILDLLIDLQTEGVTIILSTHLIQDIEAIMSRVIFINEQEVKLDIETESIQTQGESVQDYLLKVVGQTWQSK